MRVFKINACEEEEEMILIAEHERGKKLTNADYENDAEELRKFTRMLPWQTVRLYLKKVTKKK